MPRIIDWCAKGRVKTLNRNFCRIFFKNILLYMNGWLSKIRSVHTYVMPRRVYFGWICTAPSTNSDILMELNQTQELLKIKLKWLYKRSVWVDETIHHWFLLPHLLFCLSFKRDQDLLINKDRTRSCSKGNLSKKSF